MVGREGFEPPKAEPVDLQSTPFDRFGTYPQKVAVWIIAYISGKTQQKLYTISSTAILITNKRIMFKKSAVIVGIIISL